MVPGRCRRRSRYLPYSSCRRFFAPSPPSSQAGTSFPLGSAFPLFLFNRGERHEHVRPVPRQPGQRIARTHGLHIEYRPLTGQRRPSPPWVRVAWSDSVLVPRLNVARELLLRDLSEQMRHGPVDEFAAGSTDWLRLHCAHRSTRCSWCSTYCPASPDRRLKNSSGGTLTQTSVYPREVVKGALARNAAALVVRAQSPLG
jgi:hypothetical protein